MNGLGLQYGETFPLRGTVITQVHQERFRIIDGLTVFLKVDTEK